MISRVRSRTLGIYARLKDRVDGPRRPLRTCLLSARRLDRSYPSFLTSESLAIKPLIWSPISKYSKGHHFSEVGLYSAAIVSTIKRPVVIIQAMSTLITKCSAGFGGQVALVASVNFPSRKHHLEQKQLSTLRPVTTFGNVACTQRQFQASGFRNARQSPFFSTKVAVCSGSQQSTFVTLFPDVEEHTLMKGALKSGSASFLEAELHREPSFYLLPSVLDIVVADGLPDFEAASDLRALAFYEDLEARQALPFPSRFVSTFRREFAQREQRALETRTSSDHAYNTSIGLCVCLVFRCARKSIGCLDLSIRTGPCASQVNGVCVGFGEHYVYVDNVAVDIASRRRDSASAMLEASSDIAMLWGAEFVYTHVHAQNIAARRLYYAYGFRAPEGGSITESLEKCDTAQWISPRLTGLVLLRAPLPLIQVSCKNLLTTFSECRCGAVFGDCDVCICKLR